MKQSYKDLIAWQKAIKLATDVYRLTHAFPKEEMYGLCSQIRRSAVSVPSNSAEGQDRLSRGEFRQFLGMARGSLHELETQLISARDLGYVDTTNPIFEQLNEVARILNGLLSSLEAKIDRQPDNRQLTTAT
ncbi:MAG: four helix bundle protein [Planctomycetes bacterium]|nr:four helix bundle protein [Planctomycetota bacterium]